MTMQGKVALALKRFGYSNNVCARVYFALGWFQLQKLRVVNDLVYPFR